MKDQAQVILNFTRITQVDGSLQPKTNHKNRRCYVKLHVFIVSNIYTFISKETYILLSN